MNTNLFIIVKQIVTGQGEGILSEPRRLSAFFSDLARDIPKPQKNAFAKCLEYNSAQILKNASEPDRETCKQRLAQKLHEEEGFDPALCAETLNLLAAVLFGEGQNKPAPSGFPASPGSVSGGSGVTPGNMASSGPSSITSINGGTLIRINGGTFIMGSPTDEDYRSGGETQHQVTISPFYMGVYPVTQKEYQEIMGVNPSGFKKKGANLPVENISWHDAIEYCNRLSQKEGLAPAYSGDWKNIKMDRSTNAYRLPTEAEWEYACRAGTSTPFSTGKFITKKQANFLHDIDFQWSTDMTPVGRFPANPWGLFDMHGNVSEWCWDWYGEYEEKTQTDPAGPASGESRVIRGGNSCSEDKYIRSAFRDKRTPTSLERGIGFRLARG